MEISGSGLRKLILLPEILIPTEKVYQVKARKEGGIQNEMLLPRIRIIGSSRPFQNPWKYLFKPLIKSVTGIVGSFLGQKTTPVPLRQS